MKRDERDASRFRSGCGHGEDCHEYSGGTVTTNKRETVSIVGLTPGRCCTICPNSAKAYG